MPQALLHAQPRAHCQVAVPLFSPANAVTRDSRTGARDALSCADLMAQRRQEKASVERFCSARQAYEQQQSGIAGSVLIRECIDCEELALHVYRSVIYEIVSRGGMQATVGAPQLHGPLHLPISCPVKSNSAIRFGPASLPPEVVLRATASR